MTIDLLAAPDFMATHARLLDRRRFELLAGRRTPTLSPSRGLRAATTELSEDRVRDALLRRCRSDRVMGRGATRSWPPA
jgi:hypothetical protein